MSRNFFIGIAVIVLLYLVIALATPSDLSIYEAFEEQTTGGWCWSTILGGAGIGFGAFLLFYFLYKLIVGKAQQADSRGKPYYPPESSSKPSVSSTPAQSAAPRTTLMENKSAGPSSQKRGPVITANMRAAFKPMQTRRA
jgi:hypothetical protein